MTINYTCKACEHEFEISVSTYHPAKTYGPPERCRPAEGGEPDISECPKCGAEVDDDQVADLDADACRCAAEEAAERAADLKRDRMMGL